MYYIYGVSVPSLLIESTDSMIVGNFGKNYKIDDHEWLSVDIGEV